MILSATIDHAKEYGLHTEVLCYIIAHLDKNMTIEDFRTLCDNGYNEWVK